MGTEKTFDILVREGEHGAVASVFFEPALAAAGETGEEAFEALQASITELADEKPQRLFGRGGSESPEVEAVEIEIPGYDGRRFEPVDVTMNAALRKNTRNWDVELPELSIRFQLERRNQLAAACREFVRLQIPVGSRFDALARLLADTDRSLRVEEFAVETDADVEPDLPGGGDQAYPTLATAGDPLHRMLDRKDAPGAFHRDDTVDALLNCLADSRERSALLVGPAGVGKSAVVFEATRRIIDGDVNPRLEDTSVWRISGGRLTAGARFFGEWQQRIVDLIDELESSSSILFVENLGELLKATEEESESKGVAGLLLPHIESGNLSLVTELRPEQIGLIEERFPNFLQALRRIRVEPMSGAETDAVLERVSYRLGRQHGVRLAEETRQKIIALVERFQGSEVLPGPAVDLAERMARTHRREGVESDESARPELQGEHAVEAMASETGLPRELLDPNTAFSVEDVRDHFEEAVLAQKEATDAMTDLVTVLRAGLNPPDRPMGTYLFIGPTGVGKTQTALTLAEYLFGSEDRLLRFDMSEYQDRWSAARLVGRTRGEAGQLVRRVREQPFQVILLDELEKAHESVFDILLQVLGEGRLTDALGQTVSFTNTVVIMTSNLGSGGPSKVGFDASGGESTETLEEHFRREVENYFRPEFVGRLDRIVTFDALGDSTARQLVQNALDEALAREGVARRNLDVDIADDVLDYLVDTGFDDRYGARPLRQTVESEIVARLADFLSSNPQLADTRLRIRLSDGEPIVSSASAPGR